MPATYKNLVDWAGDGTFAAVGDDVTARTLDDRTQVSIRYGRDQARQLSPTSPGEASYELDNRSRDYSPENTSSPLVGYVLPSRPSRIQATVSGVDTVLWNGYLDDFQLKPNIDERSIDVTCTDALGRLKGLTVSTQIYRGVRTGEAIGYLLDAAGWPTAARDLDLGASYLPYWWAEGGDAFEELMALAASEGPPALITVDTTGRLVFRDRHHRLTRAASLTAQSTWRSSGIEPQISAPVSYNHGWQEIVNAQTIQVPSRTIAAEASVVWSASGLVTVAPGETVQITAGGNAFVDAITPVEDVDYTELSGSVTVDLSRTSGESTTISIYSSGGATVQDLRLRAYAVQSADITVTVEDPVSIGKYGRRSQTSQLPVWCGVHDARAVLELIVGRRSERLPTISVTMRGVGHASRLAQCLGRNLSDRVRLIEAHTGLDGDCFIEQIQHVISQGGEEHVTTFGLEKAPSLVTNPLTFDVAGKGFDQGQFAQIGQDNPTTMFRFDTSGVGFDQGVFAT